MWLELGIRCVRRALRELEHLLSVKDFFGVLQLKNLFLTVIKKIILTHMKAKIYENHMKIIQLLRVYCSGQARFMNSTEEKKKPHARIEREIVTNFTSSFCRTHAFRITTNISHRWLNINAYCIKPIVILITYKRTLKHKSSLKVSR